MTADRVAFWARRALVVAVWGGVAVAWWRYTDVNDLGATDAAQRFVDLAAGAWWGVLAYLGVYLLRPLVLFPASVVTVAAGILFGPVAGVAVVVVAANASALVAYWIGRFLGRVPGRDGDGDAGDPDGDDERSATRLTRRWAGRLRANSFETVLVMRLLFLPYDLVNYVCGAVRIRAVPFLAATALGSLPGTVSFVLLGSSLERLDEGVGGLDTTALAASIVVFVTSLAIARLLRRRESSPPATSPVTTSTTSSRSSSGTPSTAPEAT